MEDLIIFAVLLSVGYGVGTYLEKRHYRSIQRREKRTNYLPAMTFGAKQPLPEAEASALFVGSVVISIDYFKWFVSLLRLWVGGSVVVYESLLDRGRREAILRMKEKAIAWGAKEIINVRLETANISSQNKNKSLVAIEVVAYGTAVR